MNYYNYTTVILSSFTIKKISKDLCKTDSELVAVFKVKPGQKLCTNVIKKAT